MSLSTLLIYFTGRPGKLFHLNLKAQVPALACPTSTTGFASDLPHVAGLFFDSIGVAGLGLNFTTFKEFPTGGTFFATGGSEASAFAAFAPWESSSEGSPGAELLGLRSCQAGSWGLHHVQALTPELRHGQGVDLPLTQAPARHRHHPTGEE